MRTPKLFCALAAVTAVFITLVMSACTLSLDPVNALGDAFRFADTNVGTLKVVNAAENGAVLYGIQIIQPDKSLSEYHFENGLFPGNSREYPLHAQITYGVKFNNGKGWSKIPLSAHFVKDETFIVTFTGKEEFSVDLSGVKGKLTVYNLIPTTKGEYVIENLRVSSAEGATDRENIAFYFYTEAGIRNGEKPDFDVLPGDYWVRAQIRNPKTGKLSKWSIPAHVGNFSTTNKDQFEISTTPSKVTVSADRGGIAIFNEKVLQDGQPGNEVDIGEGRTDFPSIPDNNSLDENGDETSNIGGNVDPDSRPVKSVKVEKLGFPTADKDGVTVDPKYTYTGEDVKTVLREGKTVKTMIYDQAVAAGGSWKLTLAEAGWYLLFFSTDGKTFSKPYPIRLEDKNGNGKIDPDEMEPSVIPPYNDKDSTWTAKQGVVVKNNTPMGGGPITKPDGSSGGVLSPADAQKPITDIKVYNLDGSLEGHYRNRQGLPVYNNKEWIIDPALSPGDYLVTLSDNNGATWTDPLFPFHVDGNGDGSINYDKTHPFWDRTVTGKPAPELTSPSDDKWKGDDANWNPGTEINPNKPIYVVVPSDPPLDKIPPGTGPKELADLEDPNGDGNYHDMPSAPGSQLDIINKEAGFVVKYVKLNFFTTPDRAYRIIDLTRITYTDGTPPVRQTGGIPAGKRLSLVGFDFKPDLYYVYLSQDGHIWWKYKIAVNIYAPWTTNIKGEIVPTSADKVEKVIYKDSDTNWDKPNGPPAGGGENGLPGSDNDSKNDDNKNDGGGVKTGILVVQNPLAAPLTSITIKQPYVKGTVLEYAGLRYENYPLNVPGTTATPQGIKNQIFVLPITTEDADKASYDSHYIPNLQNSYQVKVVGYLSESRIGECYYNVTIAPAKITFITFTYGHFGTDGKLLQGTNVETLPWVLNPFDAPGNSLHNNGSGAADGGLGNGDLDNSGGGDSRPPSYTEDEKKDNTVISGNGGGGLMQPGDDPVGFPNYSESGGNLFDRSYMSAGDRRYPSGRVQPYLPNPSVSVPFPQGGDGTKQNMNGRGYFNFRFSWPAGSDWGIGYLAIQRLQRRGTSSAKDPVGPEIVLLDAKASPTNNADMISGAGQRKLGMIYNSAGVGSIKGEDRSFNDWQKNWLGLRDPATGWQLNVAGGRLDPTQPVYRSGKAHFPQDRDAAWETDKSDKAENRENGAHRALNNPGRLYTTGVILNADGTHRELYAPLGAGFEAGEYRVTLYRGYDPLFDDSNNSDHNQPNRQKKMYRYYSDSTCSFDIIIYPGVVTTALYRSGLEKGEGAFAYTPIPQAAFGKIVVLNNPNNNDYTITAILLDKPGYQRSVNASSRLEVHRYLAALASTPSSMVGGIPNILNGNKWGAMNPLRKGQVHTFILPPGGYRIAVQSTRDRDQSRSWYGEESGTWLPVVVTEGETVYLSYRGDELSR